MYYGYQPLFAASNILTFNTDNDLHEEMTTEIKVHYDLSKVSKRTHSALQLALQRGYHNATSGKAFKILCMLAQTFDFPMFCLGQGGYILLEYDKNNDDQVTNIKFVVEQAAMLAKLSNAGDGLHTRATCWYGDGHKDGWGTALFHRPPSLTDRGLCNLLNVDRITDLSPKENRTRALQAVLRGESIVVNIKGAQ